MPKFRYRSNVTFPNIISKYHLLPLLNRQVALLTVMPKPSKNSNLLRLPAFSMGVFVATGAAAIVIAIAWHKPVLAQETLTASLPNAVAADVTISTTLADEIIENFRRVIVLHEAAPAKLSRESSIAGHQLFFKNRVLATRLINLATTRPNECNALAAQWESNPDWREVDRIALGGVLSELALKLLSENSAGTGAPAISAATTASSATSATSPTTCLSRIRAARDAAANLRHHYSQEITAALDERAATKPSPRGDWALYRQFIQGRYNVKDILAAFNFNTGPAADSSVKPTQPIQPGRKPNRPADLRDEWNDGGLPAKAVLLTFDDGPHPIHTPLILDVLDRYNIKAVFFMVGNNIGSIDANNEVTMREPALISRILKAGHHIANHTLTHPLLLKLDEVQLTEEIDRTERLLTAATPGGVGRALLFRPPYGARNDLVLTEVAARGLRSVIWNIDSRDWADPIPQSVARRVLQDVANEGRGIILFHDIHAPAVEALPIVIDALLKRGFQFARFEDDKLVVDPPAAPAAPAPSAAPLPKTTP